MVVAKKFSACLVILAMLSGYGCRNRNQQVTIENMGELKEMMKELQGVRNVSVSGIPAVEFIQSETSQVVVNGYEAELDKLVIRTSGDSVTIEYKEANENRKPALKIKVYTTNLSSLNANAIGSLQVADVLDAAGSNVSASGLGSLKMDVHVQQINCRISSAASVSLKGFSDQGTISLSAIASLNLSGFERRQAKIETSAIARQL